MKTTHSKKSKGQALVEFALILTVLLLIIFIIIEAGRLLWGWVTVQNAARDGARYAVTGQFEGPDCVLDGHAKFDYMCDLESGLRTASIVDTARQGLTGLPLNEASGTFEDDNYYNVEVWGVDNAGQIRADFGGIPNAPVVVRVYYRVPIITPLLRPIVESVPVFGQATMNNEAFGSLGGNNQAQGVPPPLPGLPTPGVTPSPTPSPTVTPSTTPLPTETPVTPTTPTATNTPTPCRVNFAEAVVNGQNYFFLNGEPGSVVTVLNATTNETIIDNVTLLNFPNPDRSCDGFAAPELTQDQIDLFTTGNVLFVSSSDNTNNTTIVLAAPPTETPTITNTPAPSATPSSTPTQTPTPNPNAHFFLVPNCGFPGNNNQITLNIIGADNWDYNADVEITWDGVGLYTVPRQDITNGVFDPLALLVSGSSFDLTNGVHTIRAEQRQNNNNINVFTASYRTPCDDATPVPTATATGTPVPADMIVVGPPVPITTPVDAYDPVTYRVVISNTGDVDVNDQFFVDIFFDPSITVTQNTQSLPIADSVGYMAVSQLPGQTSRELTITTLEGFTNDPITHTVYAMVDSILQVDELSEINNISELHIADYVTPAPTPTPIATADPNGTDIVHGVIGEVINNTLVGYNRVRVRLWSDTTLLGQIETDQNGYFAFGSLVNGTDYYVTACFAIDNQTYSWTTQTVQPPFFFYIDSLQLGPCQ